MTALNFKRVTGVYSYTPCVGIKLIEKRPLEALTASQRDSKESLAL